MRSYSDLQEIYKQEIVTIGIYKKGGESKIRKPKAVTKTLNSKYQI